MINNSFETGTISKAFFLSFSHIQYSGYTHIYLRIHFVSVKNRDKDRNRPCIGSNIQSLNCQPFFPKLFTEGGIMSFF